MLHGLDEKQNYKKCIKLPFGLRTKNYTWNVSNRDLNLLFWKAYVTVPDFSTLYTYTYRLHLHYHDSVIKPDIFYSSVFSESKSRLSLWTHVSSLQKFHLRCGCCCYGVHVLLPLNKKVWIDAFRLQHTPRKKLSRPNLQTHLWRFALTRINLIP